MVYGRVLSSVNSSWIILVLFIKDFWLFTEPDEDLDIAVRTIREAEEDALATVR